MVSHNRSDDDESRDRSVRHLSCGDGSCGRIAAAPETPALDAAELSERGSQAKGLLWLAGGFLFCPCHLPLTLWLISALLAGTAAGALLRDHVVAAGLVISAIWLAATWRGLRLLK